MPLGGELCLDKRRAFVSTRDEPSTEAAGMKSS